MGSASSRQKEGEQEPREKRSLARDGCRSRVALVPVFGRCLRALGPVVVRDRTASFLSSRGVALSPPSPLLPHLGSCSLLAQAPS